MFDVYSIIYSIHIVLLALMPHSPVNFFRLVVKIDTPILQNKAITCARICGGSWHHQLLNWIWVSKLLEVYVKSMMKRDTWIYLKSNRI